MEEEIWRTIEIFPRYDISSEGRVRNNVSGRILSNGRRNRVVISDQGELIALYIDKLLDEYFGNEEEIWRTFPEARTYEVSNLGRVRNRRTGRLKKIKTQYGKAYVEFTDFGDHFQRPLSYVMETSFGRHIF